MSDIPDWLKSLYLCYLGRDKFTRVAAITHFVVQHDGRKFFDKYSTPSDTILKFLKKLDDKGLEL
jgi:hypothetical protein